MPEITISKLKEEKTAEQPVEIVERKGIGHPDSLCDGIVERFSHYLTEYYYEHFGTPLHHNVDKAVLVGGEATPKFGGGEVKEPILLHIVGRATERVKTAKGIKNVPVREIGEEAVLDHLNEVFRYLDPNHHVETKFSVRPGSGDLQAIFENEGEVPLANDTSVGVGFYPFTSAEQLCLETEHLLNSSSFKEKYPAVGEDVKVLAVRKKDKINLTVAAAMISQLVDDLDGYLELKRQVKEEIKEKALELLHGKPEELGTITLNGADQPEKENVYLTVTGTSAEAGDDGEVGRGNRVNGLITPYRFLSLEAAAGKNPVSHVGKIYQVGGHELAKRIYEGVDGVESAYAFLASEIGTAITKPQAIDIKVVPNGPITNNMKREIEKIAESYLKNLGSFWREFIDRKPPVY